MPGKIGKSGVRRWVRSTTREKERGGFAAVGGDDGVDGAFGVPWLMLATTCGAHMGHSLTVGLRSRDTADDTLR